MNEMGVMHSVDGGVCSKVDMSTVPLLSDDRFTAGTAVGMSIYFSFGRSSSWLWDHRLEGDHVHFGKHLFKFHRLLT